MVVISWLSGDQFSDEHTASWLAGAPFLSALGLPPAAIDTANLILRKSTHFVEYATLALLTARALAGRPPATRLLGALLLAVAWACGDEFRQTLTATRSGTAHDVVLDAAGAATGVLVAAWLGARPGRDAP